MRRLLRHLLLLVLAQCTGHATGAESGRVTIVSHLDGDYYQRFLQTLSRHLEGADVVISEQRVFPAGNDPTADTPDLIVAAGTRSCNDVLTHASSPALCVFISKGGYARLKQQATADFHSAIYLGQSVSRLINLANIVEPTANRISFLLGPTTLHQRDELKIIAENSGTQILTLAISPKDNPAPYIQKQLERNDVLVAIPDQDVYNRHTLHGVLLTAYRKDIPVVGFSESFVNAGAVAGVYSAPDDIARATADVVNAYFSQSDRQLPAPGYPEYFSISVNFRVAQALGLALPPPERIHTLLIDMESDSK